MYLALETNANLAALLENEQPYKLNSGECLGLSDDIHYTNSCEVKDTSFDKDAAKQYFRRKELTFDFNLGDPLDN
jgi:propanediol dehydratase small subunit